MKLSVSNIAWSPERDETVLNLLKKHGFSGVEIAPTRLFPEAPYDRIDEAKTLKNDLETRFKLEISSIPLNFLIPVKGTPLGDRMRLSTEEITRITAVFRYINPTAYIRIAAGRSYFEDGGEILFRSGANATLTGDMLTTVGNNTAQDREMLNRLGFKIKNNNNNKEEIEK